MLNKKLSFWGKLDSCAGRTCQNTIYRAQKNTVSRFCSCFPPIITTKRLSIQFNEIIGAVPLKLQGKLILEGFLESFI